ncbi:MAG: hypothetical protein ACREFL_12790, partial [Stellaceae bacterium]
MPERFAASGPEALLEALRARERFAPAEILETALAGLRQPWSVYRHHRLSAFEAGRDGGYGGLYIVLHPGKGIALVDLELAAPFSALLRLRRLLQATQFEPFLRDQPPVVALALNRGDLRNLERRLSDALACAGPCRIAEADWTGTAVAAIASVDFGLTQVKGGASLALPRPNPRPNAFPQLPALATAAGRMGQALMRVAEMREGGWTAPFFPLAKAGGASVVRAVRICGRLPPLSRQDLARLGFTLLGQKRYAAAMWRQAVPRALVPARDGLRKLWKERGSTQIAIAHRSRAIFSEGFRAIGAAVHEASRGVSPGFGRVRAQSRDALRLAGTGLLIRAQRGRSRAYSGASIAAAAALASLDSVHGALGGTALAPSRLGAALPLRLSQALLRSPAARRIEWRGNPLALGIAGAALGAVAAGFLIAAHGPLTPTQAPLALAQGAVAIAAEPPGQAQAQPAIVQKARGPAQVSPTRVQAPPATAKQPGRAGELAAADRPAKAAASPAAIGTSSEAPRNAAAPKPLAALPAPLLEPAAIPEPELDAPPPNPQAAPAFASRARPLESGAIKKAPKPAAEIAAVPLAPLLYPSPPKASFRAESTALP